MTHGFLGAVDNDGRPLELPDAAMSSRDAEARLVGGVVVVPGEVGCRHSDALWCDECRVQLVAALRAAGWSVVA